MIASLPMYDRPETRGAHDRLWQKFREAFGDTAPAALTRGADPWEDWQHPELLLSQTCGLPYRARLYRSVTLVGTPVHDLSCPPGHYFSVILVRAGDPTPGAVRLAVNEGLSQSGWAAAHEFLSTKGIKIAEVFRTGAHLGCHCKCFS